MGQAKGQQRKAPLRLKSGEILYLHSLWTRKLLRELWTKKAKSSTGTFFNWDQLKRECCNPCCFLWLIWLTVNLHHVWPVFLKSEYSFEIIFICHCFNITNHTPEFLFEFPLFMCGKKLWRITTNNYSFLNVFLYFFHLMYYVFLRISRKS